MANNTIETRRPDKRSAPAEGARREPRPRLDGAPVRGHPANENDPGSAIMLAKLRRQPSHAPYYAAFILSLIWVGGWFFTYSAALTSPDGGLVSRGLPDIMGALALLALPIGIGWVVAYFLWRASQLRQVSEVLMQSAMRLIRPQDIATEGITTLAQAVRSEVDLLVGGVEHAVQRATALEEIVHKEIAAIERAFGGNEDRIRNLVAGIENQRTALHQAGLTINNDANPLMARLETNTKHLDSVIGNAHTTLDRLEKGMRETTVDLARAIDEVTGRASAAGEEIVTQASQLERTSNMMTGELRDFSRHLSSQIEQLMQATGTLSSESSDFGRYVQGMEATVVQTVRNSLEQLTGVNQNVAQAVEQATAHATATLQRAGTETAREIEQGRILVTQGLQTVAADYLGNIAKSRADLVEYLDSSSQNIAGAITQAAETVSNNISAASTQFLSGIDQTANNLVSELNSTGMGLAGRVEQAAGKLFSEIEMRAESIAADLGGTSDRLLGQLESTISTVAGNLDSTSGTIAAHLKETADIVNRQMQDSGIALASNIESSGGIITEKLISVSGNFAQNVTQTRQELTELIMANTKMMTERLDTTATDMTNAFAETAVRVTRQVNEANSLMAQRLEKTSAEVTSQLDTTSSQILTGLGHTTLQITGRLEQDTGLLVDRVDRAAKQLDSVSSDTAAKLDDAHRKFSKHVETANIYLAEQLSSAATVIDERLEGISMNLTGKLETTGSLLSERLDDVSSLVERSLEKFNEEMERVLINRKDALDLLIGDASRRADEVDAVMTSYMKLIESSLASSEARSMDIGRILAEQTAQASANLEREIAKMESSSGGQIAEAARALRDQHERAMTAMNEMLSATATDFQQTAQDMRITAQQVVKDIDVARSEVKQAITGLPEETRNNADAMRRVVSDQISALNALAEVVKRQTGTLDLSGPGISLQRSYRDPSPGKTEGATVQALHNGTAGAQQRNTGRSETGSTGGNETAEQTRALRGKLLADLAQTSTRIGESVKAPRNPALQALPRDMEVLIDKLNLAARELVEAIDGSLPRDLEKRFRDGERGVYTLRLHEGRSKRLQKLIAERYANDRLVRGRVDASVNLFEQLLGVMSTVPRGEAMVEACLASESGRIYTMLAEASGRIASQ